MSVLRAAVRALGASTAVGAILRGGLAAQIGCGWPALARASARVALVVRPTSTDATAAARLARIAVLKLTTGVQAENPCNELLSRSYVVETRNTGPVTQIRSGTGKASLERAVGGRQALCSRQGCDARQRSRVLGQRPLELWHRRLGHVMSTTWSGLDAHIARDRATGGVVVMRLTAYDGEPT
jgi:hypothetical protein